MKHDPKEIPMNSHAREQQARDRVLGEEATMRQAGAGPVGTGESPAASSYCGECGGIVPRECTGRCEKLESGSGSTPRAVGTCDPPAPVECREEDWREARRLIDNQAHGAVAALLGGRRRARQEATDIRATADQLRREVERVKDLALYYQDLQKKEIGDLRATCDQLRRVVERLTAKLAEAGGSDG